LVGVREDSFLMSNVSILKFSISCMLLDKKTNLSWRLVIVYGSPYDEGKPEFIDELHLVLSKWQGPTIVGGDFNLYRFALDKSNGRINQKMADHFNDFINKWGLVEVSPSNRKFTWSINQKNLISAKIDRVLVTTDWEALFPFVKISCLSKGISDHIPLLLESGDNCFFW
jgi:endonuclease/exonuclease/phosphatase family metal-dependent hydrolase